jgi:hypothetical protein
VCVCVCVCVCMCVCGWGVTLLFDRSQLVHFKCTFELSTRVRYSRFEERALEYVLLIRLLVYS